MKRKKKTHIKFTISKLGAKTITTTKQTHCIIHIKLKRNCEKKKVKGKKFVLYKGNIFAFLNKTITKGKNNIKKYKNPSEGFLDMHMV